MLKAVRRLFVLSVPLCAGLVLTAQSTMQIPPAQSGAPHPLPPYTAGLALTAQSATQTAQVQPGAPHPLPPYTKELKTTSVQTLANGTTITHTRSQVNARDSQGRTYSTMQIGSEMSQNPWTIFRVTDPVARTTTRWDSRTKRATVTPQLPPGASGCWVTEPGHESIRVMGRSGVPSTRDSTASVSVSGAGSGPPAAAPAPARPEMQQDLGIKTIAGVEAQGTRLTRTLPAGAVGNDQPLVSTIENWTSKDLGLLRSVSDDPRNGVGTTEVVKLDLAEPDPYLFMPPLDYEVETETLHQVDCHQ